MILSACSDNTETSTEALSSKADRPAHAFDDIRHIVVEQHDTDAHEIVTATAHLCSVTDNRCPDGSEKLIILGSHRFLPHDVHLYDPDTMLMPPDECLATGSYCLLSVSHCEFASVEDMTTAEHCVPEGSQFVEAASDFDLLSHHECVTATAQASRHIDLECVRTGSVQINEPAPVTQEDSPS